jgi:WD40 domain-containing protein
MAGHDTNLGLDNVAEDHRTTLRWKTVLRGLRMARSFWGMFAVTGFYVLWIPIGGVLIILVAGAYFLGLVDTFEQAPVGPIVLYGMLLPLGVMAVLVWSAKLYARVLWCAVPEPASARLLAVISVLARLAVVVTLGYLWNQGIGFPEALQSEAAAACLVVVWIGFGAERWYLRVLMRHFAETVLVFRKKKTWREVEFTPVVIFIAVITLWTFEVFGILTTFEAFGKNGMDEGLSALLCVGVALSLLMQLWPGPRLIDTLDVLMDPFPEVERRMVGLMRGQTFVAFSRDGKTLASQDNIDDEISFWDMDTGKEQATRSVPIEYDSAAASCDDCSVSAGCGVVGAFSHDCKTFVFGGPFATVKLCDMTSMLPKPALKEHEQWIFVLEFSPDGNTLASGGGVTTIKLWSLPSGQERLSLEGHTSAVLCLAFSPDGKRIASGSEDGSVRLWDAGTGQELARLVGHAGVIQSVEFSPDGKTVASGSDDKSAKLWDVATAEERVTLTGHAMGVNSVAFSHDGRTVASGSRDCSVRLWDAVTGRPLATVHAHAKDVTTVVFSSDGQTLFSSGLDNTVRLWDVPKLLRQRSVEKN